MSKNRLHQSFVHPHGYHLSPLHQSQFSLSSTPNSSKLLVQPFREPRSAALPTNPCSLHRQFIYANITVRSESWERTSNVQMTVLWLRSLKQNAVNLPENCHRNDRGHQTAQIIPGLVGW